MRVMWCLRGVGGTPTGSEPAPSPRGRAPSVAPRTSHPDPWVALDLPNCVNRILRQPYAIQPPTRVRISMPVLRGHQLGPKIPKDLLCRCLCLAAEGVCVLALGRFHCGSPGPVGPGGCVVC